MTQDSPASLSYERTEKCLSSPLELHKEWTAAMAELCKIFGEPRWVLEQRGQGRGFTLPPQGLWAPAGAAWVGSGFRRVSNHAQPCSSLSHLPSPISLPTIRQVGLNVIVSPVKFFPHCSWPLGRSGDAARPRAPRTVFQTPHESAKLVLSRPTGTWGPQPHRWSYSPQLQLDPPVQLHSYTF